MGEVPEAPVANDNEAETLPGAPVLVDVALNDRHPDDFPLEVTNIASQPENGVCKVVAGKVRYTPGQGFTAG